MAACMCPQCAACHVLPQGVRWCWLHKTDLGQHRSGRAHKGCARAAINRHHLPLQGARLVDIALESGAAFSGEGFQYIKPALAEHTLHFIGLLSDGGEPGGGFRVQG
jgi:hypothetical protein